MFYLGHSVSIVDLEPVLMEEMSLGKYIISKNKLLGNWCGWIPTKRVSRKSILRNNIFIYIQSIKLIKSI